MTRTRSRASSTHIATSARRDGTCADPREGGWAMSSHPWQTAASSAQNDFKHPGTDCQSSASPGFAVSCTNSGLTGQRPAGGPGAAPPGAFDEPTGAWAAVSYRALARSKLSPGAGSGQASTHEAATSTVTRPPPVVRVRVRGQASGPAQGLVTLIPATRPLALTTRAILRDASSIISSPSITAPR